MSVTTACRVCTAPSPDATICRVCGETLARNIADIPALCRELDITLSRQARMGSGGKRTEIPLPYSVAASEQLSNIRGTLVGWIRDMVEI